MSQHVFPTNLNEIGTKIFPHNELIRRGDPNYYHYTPADAIYGDKFIDNQSLSPSAGPKIETRRSPGTGKPYSPLGDNPSTRVTKAHNTSSTSSTHSVNNSFEAVISTERQHVHESPKETVERPSNLNVANAINEYVEHHERLQHLDNAVDITPSPLVDSAHQHQVGELIREAELREHETNVHEHHDQHSVEHHVEHHVEKYGHDQQQHHEHHLQEESTNISAVKHEVEPVHEHIYDSVPDENGYEVVPNIAVEEGLVEESVRERVEEYEHQHHNDVQQQEHHQQHSKPHGHEQHEQLLVQTDPIDSFELRQEEIGIREHHDESRENGGELVQTLAHQMELREQVHLHEQQHVHSDEHTTVHHTEHHQQQQLEQLDHQQHDDDHTTAHHATHNTVKQMVNEHERRQHHDEHTPEHHAAHHKAKLAAVLQQQQQQQQQQQIKEDPTLTVMHDRHEVLLKIEVKDTRQESFVDNEIDKNNAAYVQLRSTETSPKTRIEQQYPLVDSPTKLKTDAIIAQLKSVGADTGGLKTLKDLKEEKRLSYQRKEEEVTAEIERVRREFTAEKFLNEAPTHGGKSGFELPEWKRRQIAQKKAEEAAKLEEARILKEFEDWKLAQSPGWVKDLKQRKSGP